MPSREDVPGKTITVLNQVSLQSCLGNSQDLDLRVKWGQVRVQREEPPHLPRPPTSVFPAY